MSQVSDLPLRCGTLLCPGPVVPVAAPPPEPDVWIRVHANGSWWCSDIGPMAPQEHAGTAGYWCSGCGKALRAVDGPMWRGA